MTATTLIESHQGNGLSLKVFKISVPFKYVSLFFLVVQNSTLMLTMRYSRTVEGPQYITSTAVVLAEILKIMCSLFLLFAEDRFVLVNALARLKYEFYSVPAGMIKLAIPSILYTIQNNLQYVAASHLDAATLQVSYQLKILTTALFSVIILQRSLTGYKWLSLLILTLGVGLVQIPPESATWAHLPSWMHPESNGSYIDHPPPQIYQTAKLFTTSDKNNAAHNEDGNGGEMKQNPLIGFSAVLIACILSGFAGVYFEKILKGGTASIWIRNLQLGIYGTLLGLLVVLGQDRDLIRQYGFFHGYRRITVLVILNQAIGGLLVAVVVKYADNILKGYATSISIIISTIISVFIFGFEITTLFFLGSAMVLTAVFIYSK